ncbi:2-C-methyl-D-erythritol 4-phosphate cytidylyltransferase [Janibacter cremeus]|uniref:2-C-methyl-D-erythritol 4-phosphate cytidylyltransferase n=1 Tax=Janibacter cremeus TaxID=1285192 RepID=A0A852VVZ3_9MICO|nr:2-C-methyl-D-erythritol 4-phosphate cytidylyltransferase [Janibacter cremeus]
MGVVVVAAGSGTRLGAERPKAFVELSGMTLLEHALRGVVATAGVDEVIVVVPADLVAGAEAVAAPMTGPTGPTLQVVPGGAERTDSVAAGLAALSGAVRIVLVHDAARCLTPVVVFERVLEALDGGAAGAVPGVPVVDTIKVIDGEGLVTGTPSRDSLRAVQTPQGFRREVLEQAHACAVAATDDAALVEALGHPVLVVEGDHRSLKITTPEDLERAERLLRLTAG